MNEFDPELLYELIEDVSLSEPVLIVSLEGWIDAGLGASSAMNSLLESGPTTLVACFDADEFLDQRARRPIVRIVDGVNQGLSWPEIELRAGKDLDGNDVLFLVGPEPDTRWAPFVDSVIDLAQRFDVRLVMGLGAFPAPAPHTRPVKLAGTVPAESRHLLDNVGMAAGEIEVPAGITSAIELACGEAGIDCITLWARVPHYVAGMSFPQASAALIEGVNVVGSLRFDEGALLSAADTSRREVDDLISSNPEHEHMVHSLEVTLDAAEGNTLGVDELPTGDELVAEFEEFLRDQGN